MALISFANITETVIAIMQYLYVVYVEHTYMPVCRYTCTCLHVCMFYLVHCAQICYLNTIPYYFKKLLTYNLSYT